MFWRKGLWLRFRVFRQISDRYSGPRVNSEKVHRLSRWSDAFLCRCLAVSGSQDKSTAPCSDEKRAHELEKRRSASRLAIPALMTVIQERRCWIGTHSAG
jgi:hypothetical protein